MGWSVFALIYAFWLETLAMSFFNSIRIVFAEKSVQPVPHIGRAFSYMFGRILVLLFYMIFILAFIGFQMSEENMGHDFANYLLFIDDSFRITIMIFFFIKLVELIYNYFYLNGKEKTAPTDFSALFDSRIIIMHVVIVLGVFAHQFFKEHFDNHTGIVAFAGVFVLVKMIGEYFAGVFTAAKNEPNY